jgi:adenine/guanine phosphoribosyltransferase-like PRPP-binding protein
MIDRMADTIHCQLFTGKYGCAVSVAGGPAYTETTGYISRILTGFGADTVGAVGASASQTGAVAAALPAARALGQTLVQAVRQKQTYPEQEVIHQELRERFRNLVTAHKDAWKHEYEHWLDKGWI